MTHKNNNFMKLKIFFKRFIFSELKEAIEHLFFKNERNGRFGSNF